MDPTRSANHRTVFSLAWPVIVSLLSLTAMGLVDALFVGRLGTDQLAAVGLAIPLVYLIFAAPLGVLLGAKVVVAQRFGAGDSAGLDRAAWTSFGLAAALGVLGLTAGWWFTGRARLGCATSRRCARGAVRADPRPRSATRVRLPGDAGGLPGPRQHAHADGGGADLERRDDRARALSHLRCRPVRRDGHRRGGARQHGGQGSARSRSCVRSCG
jgi:hypothetical protein